MSDNALHYAPPASYAKPLTHGPVRKAIAGTRTHVRVGLIAMTIAFMLFAVFGSEKMRQAARDLPGSELSDVAVNTADLWHALMLSLGPAHVRPRLRSYLERLRTADWPHF